MRGAGDTRATIRFRRVLARRSFTSQTKKTLSYNLAGDRTIPVGISFHLRTDQGAPRRRLTAIENGVSTEPRALRQGKDMARLAAMAARICLARVTAPARNSMLVAQGTVLALHVWLGRVGAVKLDVSDEIRDALAANSANCLKSLLERCAALPWAMARARRALRRSAGVPRGLPCNG